MFVKTAFKIQQVSFQSKIDNSLSGCAPDKPLKVSMQRLRRLELSLPTLSLHYHEPRLQGM